MYPLASAAAHILLTLSTVNAVGVAPNQIKNLVTFGDSFTDVVTVGDSGVAWPVYAAGYTNTSLIPFARTGATCSNVITPRSSPSLFETQLPLYFSRKGYGFLNQDPKETLYTLWIGTNDVGVNSLLTGSNKASILDVRECAVNWINALYRTGARNFLFQNMAPLYAAPLYSANSYPNRYWTTARNTTEWNIFMRELILSGNALSKLLLEKLAPTLPDAHIGLFDTHGLFTDIINRPSAYLNGTAPPNVTGASHACVFAPGATTGSCTTVSGPARDSYLWYDELHPSEQADRIVAREVATVIQGGGNPWITWLS